MNPYEIAGAIFGVLGVWLTVRENVWCWPTGIVNVGLYIFVFYQSRLYADMGLQVVYLVLSAYGWWSWLHGGQDRGALRVSRAPGRALALLAGAGAVGGLGLGILLQRHTDASLPFWDSATTSYSLVAQYMLTRKWIENWWVWIAVDVVYLGIYTAKHLPWTTGLYAVFLVLAVRGLVAWKRSLRTGEPAGASA